jgi:hypothetical protein
MAFLQGARSVLIWWLWWLGLLGLLAGNAKGKEAYEFDLHGLPQIRHL